MSVYMIIYMYFAHGSIDWLYYECLQAFVSTLLVPIFYQVPVD